jgi:amino acid transporter
MKKTAKISLYFIIVGGFLLLGGIAFQMLIGISTMLISDSTMEQFGYALMSRGSIILIIAYSIIFISGLVFWRTGPYKFKEHRWFLVCFLLFYGWLPIDIYTMFLDIKFAILFNPDIPITSELKNLFLSRQTTLGPIPLIMLIGYLTCIGFAIFKPQLKRRKSK